jgi:rubrerythrin
MKQFCNECDELNTCELMQKFLKDAIQQDVLKNMEMIRQNGLSKWLEAQQQRWRCTNCGAYHSWWDETCPQCGQAVANFKADVL